MPVAAVALLADGARCNVRGPFCTVHGRGLGGGMDPVGAGGGIGGGAVMVGSVVGSGAGGSTTGE